MIKPGEYKIITNLINDMLSSTIGASQNISDIHITLSNTDTQNLAKSFNGVMSSTFNTYNKVLDDATKYPQTLLLFVSKLNSYILKKYRANTVDEFLDESFLEVGKFFAEISNSLDFNITRIGYKSARWSDIDVPINELGSGDDPNPNLNWDFIGGTNRCK
tara:strand:+ start:1072 stop:1554 length:483 start_codon:yes stop_codon:yes gene_type:complete